MFKRVACVAGLAAVLSLVSFAVQAESLESALASAYVNNPQIASALLSVKASAEDIALRKAGKLPTIGLNASTSYTWSVAAGTTKSSSTSSVNLTYQHRLFDNFVTDAQIEQARAYSDVATQSLRNAEQNVLLSTANAYVGVVRDTRLLQLRAENVGFLQAQVKSSKDRLDVGEGTKTDVSQAEARLAQAVAAYKSAANNLRTSQATFARWVGHAPQNLSLDYDMSKLLPASLESAIDLADRNHPAILTAKAMIRAAQSGSEAARAAFGPTFDLIGSICGYECGAPGTQGASGSIRLTLSIPLYKGGAMGATARKANLEQIKSEVDALNTRDQVRESVISSWSGVQNSTAQMTSTAATVAASRAVLNGVIEERNVGQRTTLDVLNSQSELIGAQEGRIIAETSQISAAFALASAVGRLSAQELRLPVALTSAEGYREKVEDIWQDLRALPN